MKKNNHGFAPIIILVLIALVIVGYFGYKNYWPKLQSFVIPTPIATADPTANWKTYTNSQYGFEFKYPQDWYAKQMTGWTFNVFLNDHDFEIPTMTEFITPIQISFNEVMDTTTNIKRYSEKTIEEAAKRIKADIYGENVGETDNLIIGGHKAIQLVGTAGPGMLEGQYYKVTYIQMDNKVLTVALINNKSFETIYNQILSTFKFLDQTPNPVSLSTYRNTAYKYQISYNSNFKIGHIAAGAQPSNVPPNANDVYVYDINNPDYSKRLVDINHLGLLIPLTPASEWQKTATTLNGIKADKYTSAASSFDIYQVPPGFEIYVQKNNADAIQILSTFSITQ